MSHKSALDDYLSFYAKPAPTTPSPTKTPLSPTKNPVSPPRSSSLSTSQNGLASSASSPALKTSQKDATSPPLSSSASTPSPSLSASATTSPTGTSPPPNEYNPNAMKKSFSAGHLSAIHHARSHSELNTSSTSTNSSSDSPNMERSNSMVINSDELQEVFINEQAEDYYDDDTTEEDSSGGPSEADGTDEVMSLGSSVSPTNTISISPTGTYSIPGFSVQTTVVQKKKSPSNRYFAHSDSSVERFYRVSLDLTEEEKNLVSTGAQSEALREGEKAVRFKKSTEEDYSKMSANPEAFVSDKLSRLQRRASRMPEKEESFLPSKETLAKCAAAKRFFDEKYGLIATDPERYKREMLNSLGVVPGEPLRFAQGDVKKKMKKLNVQDKAGKPGGGRDRSKSSPPVPQIARSLSLAEILAREKSTIPRLVQLCLEFLSTDESLDTEGLFRVAGSSYEIDILWDSLAEGEDIPATSDVHTVASVFKKFFRELKEPLFTYKLHKKFLAAVNDDNTQEESIQQLKDAMNELPEANKRIIRELFKFLKKVLDHSSSNMMHAINLGIVFGPSLLRDDSSSMAMFDNRNQVVSTILENCETIFNFEAETTGAGEGTAPQ